MRRSKFLLVALIATPTVVVSACGGDGDGAFATLPPIRTTTTTSTTTTTLSTERRFHVIQPGENLSIIADSYEVPLELIIEINDIANPDNIPAGETIEIPSGFVIFNRGLEAGGSPGGDDDGGDDSDDGDDGDGDGNEEESE